jgi:hypothetical protein
VSGLSSYDSVARLSLEELRRLLESGDAPERLWSAWAIALRLGSEATPLLTQMERRGLPEGTKRHLLVVLAGLGQRDLLLTIANEDPSESVAATATTLYLRTAPSPNERAAVDFAVQQLRAGRTAARVAVLAEDEAGRVMVPLPERLASLRDPEFVVRRACLTGLAVRPGCDQEPVARALVELFVTELELDVRRQCVALIPRSSLRELFRAVAERRPSTVGDALRLVFEQFGALTWLEVGDLTETTSVPDLLDLMAVGVRPPTPQDVSWLCRALRIAKSDDSWVAESLLWRSRQMLGELLDEKGIASLSPADRTLLMEDFCEALLRFEQQRDELEDPLEAVLRRVLQLLRAAPTAETPRTPRPE